MKHGLGLYEPRTGFNLFIQTDQSHFKRFGERICGCTDQKLGRFFHLLAGQEKTFVHLSDSGNELDGIKIEHALGFGLIAEFLVVAGKAQYIMDT